MIVGGKHGILAKILVCCDGFIELGSICGATTV
jgi:hypothetical protein